MTLTETARRHANAAWWLSALAVVGSLLVVGAMLPVDRAVVALQGWLDGLGVWAPAIFAAIYALATVLMLPGLILTIAGGAIFGLVRGTIAVSVGSTVGAALAFLIARYVARRKVSELARSRPRFRAVDEAIGEGGWRIVALLRLSPAVPFNLQNYVYGLTRIRFGPCVLASWLAMLPATVMYVYIGHIAGVVAAGDRQRSAFEWAALAVGLLATVAVSVYATRLARRKLREQTRLDGPAADPSPVGRRGGWPWGATVAAIAATLAVGAAAYARVNEERINAVITGLFGPPAVRMTEAYDPIGSATVDHSAFDELLRAVVDGAGWVDYDRLQGRVATLDQYLALLADVPFDDLGRDEKLALLINAYNAFTLKLILSNEPVSSITTLDRPWTGPTWNLAGRSWTLEQIEHAQIRPKFEEPRIHFALVCAAVGCPPLRAGAYTADGLEEQLETQARYAHEHGTWLRFEESENQLRLTKLYDWYGGDFEQAAGSVHDFVARYVPAVGRRLAAGERPRIRWLPYDWDLNSVENRVAR